MKFICAGSVTLGREAFSTLGELKEVAETEIDRECVEDADVVVTRSKNRLDAGLFKGSTVKFAGTCTAGTDHANLSELAALDIHFASAPGCNANAVSEYVVAALLEAPDFRFAGKTVGIIGHGEVGTRVDAKLQALGCRVLRYDPPKKAAGGVGPFVDLDFLLAESDVVTLHIPLVEDGLYPTRNLLGKKEIGKLKSGVCVINACRGEVVDGEALRTARLSGRISWLVVDVWDPEPEIPQQLLEAADIATPHIAGHSVEGKVNGTRQIREQVLVYFGLDAEAWDPQPLMPSPACEVVDPGEGGDFESRLRRAVSACYDIQVDNRLLRVEEKPLAERFVAQRRTYRNRREFSATEIQGVKEDERAVYLALGFRVSSKG